MSETMRRSRSTAEGYVRSAPQGIRNGLDVLIRPGDLTYKRGAPRPAWAVRAIAAAKRQYPEPPPVPVGRPRGQRSASLSHGKPAVVPAESNEVLDSKEVCDDCLYLMRECKCSSHD